HRQATADTLSVLGWLALEENDPPRAFAALDEAIAIQRELGNPLGLAWLLQRVGNAHFAERDFARARAIHEEGLEIFRGHAYPYGIASGGVNLGSVLDRLGEPARARALYREALAIYRNLGNGVGIVWSIRRIAIGEARYGDARTAVRLMGAVSAVL